MTIVQADLEDQRVHDEIDQWVCARSASTPFHRPAWIKAVATGNRQRAIMLVARRTGGEIEGVLPLNLIASRLFGRALVSSGFAVDGGILTDDTAVAEALATECWSLAQKFDCSTSELRGGVLPAQDWVLKSDTYLNFVKPLEASDEAQLLSVPKRHRAQVRKGLEHNMAVEFGRSREMLDIVYRLYADNVHRLGTPVFPKTMFSHMLQLMGDAAELVVVRKEGEPVTASFHLYHNGSCMPYWHGAGPRARELHSNEVAYYRLMCHAREQGCTMFDFGRSKVGSGPVQWKKSWGCEGTPLTYAIRSEPGKEPRDINPMSPQYQRKIEMWKKLPLPVANLLGPLISRGLG
jgi:FemAB-related protein (PEP-CTERM system-associated)